MLATPQPEEKARAARNLAQNWRDLPFSSGSAPTRAPKAPARPSRPRILPPSEVPRRRLGSQAGRAALLHAVAHIEFNAIDLACDMALRFSPAVMDLFGDEARRDFLADWISVADDEARHFGLVSDRLAAYGVVYGDLPAHGGLWDAARATSGDLLARLAVAPMVLEARGLDVTPKMIAKLRRAGDENSAAALETIYNEEVRHVAIGVAWFQRICTAKGLAAVAVFQDKVREYYKGGLKPPFNETARARAGLLQDFYRPLSW
ncbi:MAG: ferritin-like domain-containing protein [Parvularculaceae bacterium]